MTRRKHFKCRIESHLQWQYKIKVGIIGAGKKFTWDFENKCFMCTNQKLHIKLELKMFPLKSKIISKPKKQDLSF